MAADRSFAGLLRAWLTVYLPTTRGSSANTVAAYRDAFVLLLRYFQDRCGRPPERVQMDDLNPRAVNEFLTWLADTRHASAATRNQRLAAVKSFLRYAQSQAPEHIAVAGPVLALKPARSPEPVVAYLTVHAVKLILAQAKRSSLRDLALLTLLYDTGARVQEVCDLSIGDLRTNKPVTVTLTGKGRKTRTVPLTGQAAAIVVSHAATLDGRPAKTPLFENRDGRRIGRAGISWILQDAVTRARAGHEDEIPQKATPHQLRHSKAVHLLENGVNLVYIRDLLGHASVTTTERYAKASPEMKRKAIESASAGIVTETIYDPGTRQDLLTWLRQTL
ncbi:MAG: site-specific integrase [Bifidobacteriaceae bacterium]|jgi:site-specific recombinase XerD|nr:site-specific integrase [Bifidobacteriaceae bacterium]